MQPVQPVHQSAFAAEVTEAEREACIRRMNERTSPACSHASMLQYRVYESESLGEAGDAASTLQTHMVQVGTAVPCVSCEVPWSLVTAVPRHTPSPLQWCY